MSISTKTASTRLAGVVGEQNCSADAAQLTMYEIDGARPSTVVRPSSKGEVAEIVKAAASERLTIVPSGARTKLGIGLTPQKYDVALDVTRLDRVIAYDPDDLTLSVEAGIPLKKLAGVLAERGQFLPLAVPFFDYATVGGTIASGVDSPLRQLYGTVRDYILGIEFVTGEGFAAKSGGRVVKNVTGFDLHKLLIGSLGTLAVMTRINFRTFPLPLDTRALIANFDTAHRALDMRDRVAQSSLSPLTLEVFSPEVSTLFYSESAARIEPAPLAANSLAPRSWSFTCGFAGTSGALDRVESELRKFAEQCGASNTSCLDASQIPGAFGRKREFVPIALASSPATTILKIGILPSRLREIFDEIRGATETESLRCATMARGVGIVYAALLPESKDDDSRAKVVRAATRIQSACFRASAHATIPWCPGDWKSHLRIWGDDRGDLPQMRKVKSIFDPHKVLSPGRFVGGI